MKAPFPYFGGKRRVAPEIWEAFGDVDNYVEPFAGSLAVLLERPAWHQSARLETVNDADCYLSNFWRAVTAEPDEVARFADWPVNECDLFARHLWLVNEGRQRIERMEADPDFYDAKVAGWWVWGICSWIGSGWCAGSGPGRGVNRQLPHLGNAGRGEPPIYGYFRALASRLRNVRVCCGDWSRVVTQGALVYGSTVGILLDPPYQGDLRDGDVYRTDDPDVSSAVREWAIANGDDPRYRIALCGYETEHADFMPTKWRKHTYSAKRAYGTAGNKDSRNNTNRHQERIWFSPWCLQPQTNLWTHP